MSNNHHPRPHLLGTFEVESGQLYIADPSALVDESRILVDVKPGTWSASVLYADYILNEERCTALWCFHKEHPVMPDDPCWIDQELGAGIESGMLGFFDPLHFRDERIVTTLTKYQFTGRNLWQEYCYEVAAGEAQAGVIPFGCVVMSRGETEGYGRAYIVLRDETIVAIGYDLNVFPFVYMPELKPEEEVLFRAIRENNATAVAQLLAQQPGLVQNNVLLQYAQLYEREAALVELLRHGADARALSIEYYLRTSQPDALERIKEFIPPLDDRTAYNVLADIAKIVEPDVSLQLSKVLAATGMPVNPPPPHYDLPPVAFVFVHEMLEAYLPVLEFWIAQGLEMTVLNEHGASPEGVNSTHDAVRIRLEECIDFEKINRRRRLMGRDVRITMGEYARYCGPIVAYHHGKFDVKISIGKEKEIVPCTLDELEPY